MRTTGVGQFFFWNPGPMKRETGENPVRTRHRNKGVMAAISLGDREDGRSADL